MYNINTMCINKWFILFHCLFMYVVNIKTIQLIANGQICKGGTHKGVEYLER